MLYLIVAAHPDDEVLGAGAAMYKLSSAGEEVNVCIMSGQAEARTLRPSDHDLESLGMNWCTPVEKAWEEKYKTATEMIRKMKQVSMANRNDKERRTALNAGYPRSHSLCQWLVIRRSLLRYVTFARTDKKL